ncbi:hypothetical protein SAMN04488117_101730 [Celeribacter baekdonensis]|uniref:Uncharacterized protein n=1 Tax=Celeribacter baekdonensis TaxID=875171 RepID=A0A1G7GVA8_9RHOB|nr:hypothetical protein SAMN04488117_101730 [Celeribacter baekdonensis]
MLSKIETADRPASCAITICLLRKTAVHCRCSVDHSGLFLPFSTKGANLGYAPFEKMKEIYADGL